MTTLEELLQTKIEYADWQHKKSLPYYVAASYEIKKASLKGLETLFLFPKGNPLPVNSIKAHISKIQEIECLPVVICLNGLTYAQRQQFIKADIPFIAGEKQIYIPFIGALLLERYTATTSELKSFSPSTQCLLLYLIHRKNTKFHLAEAAEDLKLSKMAISKAQRQLVQTGVFRFEQREGKRKILVTDFDFKSVWEKCYKHLINPVKEIVYLDSLNITKGMLISGDSALSQKSMLNPPKTACYALHPTNKKSENLITAIYEFNGSEDLTVSKHKTSDQQVKLEIWKYNPSLFSSATTVDVLSLALTYKNNSDERIEDAVEEMLNIFWEEY